MDHAYHPEASVASCRRMLEHWLQEISHPTWGKLEDAIKDVEDDIKFAKGSLLFYSYITRYMYCSYSESK